MNQRQVRPTQVRPSSKIATSEFKRSSAPKQGVLADL